VGILRTLGFIGLYFVVAIGLWEILPWPYYLIAAIAVTVVIATLTKPKKKIPTAQPFMQSVNRPPDETQFYACPHCGNDTQIRYGKQYCDRCKLYI